MGTRSLTALQDNDGREIAVLYRQMDGYPEGHGAELARYLKPFHVVNGFGLGDKKGKAANGMSCLAAQPTAKFKRDIGGFYLHPAGTRDCGEEYIYTVYLKNGEVCLRCETAYGDTKLLYDGPARQWNTKAVRAAQKLQEA